MPASSIDAYRRQIERELSAGNATEHTHRPALKSLIESLASGVTATNEPKRVECGAPDFVVTRKAGHGPVTLGYIEAKDVGKDLGEAEKSDQMKRYRPALPNLILTDYLEFRWYVNGERRQTARLARVSKGGKLFPVAAVSDRRRLAVAAVYDRRLLPEAKAGGPFLRQGRLRPPLQKTFGPEDVFNYIYAIFHSPTYRSRYAEFLKSDFPRVPLTSDVKLFRSLCGLGAELVALHLLESPVLEKPIARYPIKGSDTVEKGFPKYVAPGQPEPGTGRPVKDGRVYINKAAVAPVYDRRSLSSEESGAHRAPLQEGSQYFEGVAPEVWNFHIGGYQVCEKWLKDRRGRTLTYDDQMHYCKVVTALAETIRLMAEIDAAIPQWPIA